MLGRQTKVLWLDRNHTQQVHGKELAELRKLQAVYDCLVEPTLELQETFSSKHDYVMICSSGEYKMQAELLKPKQHNLLGIIIYCRKRAQHQNLQRQPYVVLVTDDFRQVEKQLLNLLAEGDYDFGEETERRRRGDAVDDEQNRFIVVKRITHEPQFFNPEDYQRKQRSILQLFRVDFDVEKDLELTKRTLEQQLRQFLQSKQVLPLEKEFARIRQAKSLQQLVRLCVYLYSLEKGNLYESLNIILKNLRMIRFQQDFVRLRLFAFLLLLNYFFFYGQSEFVSCVCRFTDFVPEQLEEGAVITVCNFYSASKRDDLEDFKHKRTKVVIETFDHSVGGQSLAFFNYIEASRHSAYKQEQEVLFAPFTKFKVTKVQLNGKQQNTVYMKELPNNNFLWRIYDLNLLDKNQEVKGKFERELNYQFKYEKLLKARKQEGGREAAGIYRNLGVLYSQNGNHTWALDYFNKSLAITLRLSDQQQLATLANNIGLLYSKTGKHAEALAEFEQAVQIRRKLDGDQARSLIAPMSNKASLLESTNDNFQALALYQESLSICRKCYPEKHVTHANLLNNIGFVLLKIERYEEALANFVQAVSIFQYVEGELSEYVSICYENIADLYGRLKNSEKCEEFYKKAVQVEKEVRGALSPNLQNMYCGLGRLYNQRRDYESARQTYAKALEVCVAVLGPTHEETALLYNNIGSLEESIGNPEQALIYFERALELLYRVYRDRNREIIETVSENVADLKSKLEQGYFKK